MERREFQSQPLLGDARRGNEIAGVADPKIYWHGPAGDWTHQAAYGLHIGTKLAAKEALEASIGIPVSGSWDGTREYGSTLLMGKRTLRVTSHDLCGYNCSAPEEDHYATGAAHFSNGVCVSMRAKPIIFPVRIVGRMTNTPSTPHADFKANGYMKASITRGFAKSGFYYRNISEDEGSISAVVPNSTFLQPVRLLMQQDLPLATRAVCSTLQVRPEIGMGF